MSKERKFIVVLAILSLVGATGGIVGYKIHFDRKIKTRLIQHILQKPLYIPFFISVLQMCQQKSLSYPAPQKTISFKAQGKQPLSFPFFALIINDELEIKLSALMKFLWYLGFREIHFSEPDIKKILKVTIDRLSNDTGQDFGDDIAKWERWLRKSSKNRRK